MIIEFIDDNKDELGVEPICRELQVAPSTYYAARHRPLSARAVADEAALVEIDQVHEKNFRVYGARKLHAAVNRERARRVRPGGQQPARIARCTVERLMRTTGLHGVRRNGKPPRTTIPAPPDRRPDLVERNFTAAAPDRLWVADITYIHTCSGWVYAAFVQDVCTRRIVGWQCQMSWRRTYALNWPWTRFRWRSGSAGGRVRTYPG